MSDTRIRDLEHATKLSVARQLIDDLWKGAEGSAVPENFLRDTARALLLHEKLLRDGVVLRARARKSWTASEFDAKN